jgi:serralysin
VAAAHDSTDRVIYDESSGKLYYDADGSGTTASAELIATLQGAPVLTASDIAADFVGGLITGTAGNDTLVGGPGSDTLDGLAGNDTLFGNARADTLLGGTGNDSLTGNLGLDSLVGGDGNDTLDGAASGFGDSEEWHSGQLYPGDTLEGGLGDDAYYVQAGDEIREKADEGIDSVYTDMWQYALGANLENLTFSPIELSSSDGFNFAYVSIDYMGNELDNFISSGHSLMTWVPSEERDVIAGGAGNDILYGGWGTSWLQGGAGADALYGTSGNDALEGGEGNDTLAGSVDNDSLTGGAGNDNFVFDTSPSAANADSITDFVSGTDKLQLDDAAYANIGALGTFTVDDPRYWAEAGATSGHDADDRVIYDTSTGAVYYDSNGDAAGASQPVATLSGAPTLTAADIIVI